MIQRLGLDNPEPRAALDRTRVILAGAEGAPLTDAAYATLTTIPAVELVDVVYDKLQPQGVDLIVSAAHTHIIGRKVREAARFGAIGLHPSLLPRYRGSHPLWWMLRNGETEAGLTLYVLDDGIDTGPVMARKAVPIDRLDNWGSLYGRVVREVDPMLRTAFAVLTTTGMLPGSTAQDESQASVYRAPSPLAMNLFRLRRRIQRALG
jgi:methionyl-tRNA formyltransferase